MTISADEVKAKNEPEYRRKVTCTTKDDGAYEFTVTPEEAARPHLYIEASIKTSDHPEYYGGYGYSLILKNEKLGVAPFFQTAHPLARPDNRRDRENTRRSARGGRESDGVHFTHAPQAEPLGSVPQHEDR